MRTNQAWTKMKVATLALDGARPYQQCGYGHCKRLGPFLGFQLRGGGGECPLVVGICEKCAQQFSGLICSGCALKSPLSDGSWDLTCPRCGSRLGQLDERLDLRAISIPTAATCDLIPQSSWGALFREAVARGTVSSVGLEEAKQTAETGNQLRALRLLFAELRLCQRARFGPGIALCHLEIAKSFLGNDPSNALVHLQEAIPLLEHLRNPAALRECVAFTYFALRATNADRMLQASALDRAIHLYEEAVHQTAPVAVIPTLEALYRTRVTLREELGIPGACIDLMRLPEGVAKLRQLRNELHARNFATNRLVEFDGTIQWQVSVIARIRGANEAWGCPKGHTLHGSSSIVVMKSASDGTRLPCRSPGCGRALILLNRYYPFSAGVPGWGKAGWLETSTLPGVDLATLEGLNVSLSMRDAGYAEDAEALHESILESLISSGQLAQEQILDSLNALGRALQVRNEHYPSISVFNRAIAIAETSPHPSAEHLASLWNNLGISLACLDLWDEALTALRKSASAIPNYVYPHYWLALIYHKRGKPSERGSLRESAKLYLQHPPILERAQQLEQLLRSRKTTRKAKSR